MREKYYDTLITEYIKNPGTRGLGLDALSKKYLGYKTQSYEEVSDKGKINFRDVDLQVAAKYSAEDVYVTYKIFQQQKQYDDFVKKLAEKIEFPLLGVLIDMELTGVKVDTVRLQELQIKLEKKIFHLEKEIYDLAGEKFNINSPKQVGELLFVKMGIEPLKKTKTGFSVDSDVLFDLAKSYPIAKKISDFRHYSKLLSTYVIGLYDLLESDESIHTSFNQSVTTTGRLSSTNPNMQNIPVGDGIAGEIRSIFVPRDDQHIIAAFDYSQIEIRLLALLSGDKNLLDAFAKNLDIHSVTAKHIFGNKEISVVERKFAKAVNFGVIYGISPFGLSKMINVSVADAKKYIDAFYETYPDVKKYYDRLIEKAKTQGYIETIFGRRRYISGINDKNANIRKASEREAINMPIQGSNADIIKLAMIQIHKLLKEKKYTTKMILQVHDELVFDMKKTEKEELSKKIIEIMQNILKDSSVHLKVDVAFGKNWGECK